MNLKRYLLVRMITLGLLCWVLISAYVVLRTANEVDDALTSDATRLHEMVEYSMYKRQINPEIEGSPVLVGNQYGLQLAPYCIRYEGWNGQVREEGCEKQTGHPVEAQLMKLLGVQIQSEPRPVGLWGQPFGELHITADPQLVLAKFWNTLRDLLLLSTLIVTSLAALTYVVIGRALQPAATLVEKIDSIAISEDSPPPAQLPDVQPREFGRIAQGVNRLNERLWRLTQTRRKLLMKLLDVQEEERRELAHLVHADLGQSLSLIAVNCAQLRAQLKHGEPEVQEKLEEIDLQIESAFERMRAVLVNKCPPVLEGADLGLAIQDLCTRWEINSGSGWTVNLQLDAKALGSLGKDRALCVYRTVEECLANVRRHAAPGSPVNVCLSQTDKVLDLTIENSVGTPHGQGYSVPSGGMGLNLLAERVRVHGGVFHSQASAGLFVVSACFELKEV
ncbi:sensor histidine kinase [Limnobacter sp.]|uniref:sensor histidine kinase n=1 Tax=Limnobacter sp. TaxID=2003368 RepID=UPI0027325A56|nr:histidine kinase [Limnobacter sp.]MDP3188076.1 histidine kinase [Limnobacter sp.]